MTHSATGTFDQEFGGSSGPVNAGPDQSSHRSHRCGHWKGGVKSRWGGLEIAAMVGGFVVFWPLGLLALFLKWKNKEMWPGASEGSMPWSGLFDKKPSMPGTGSFKGFGFGGFSGPSSGNAAFDAYKREQLARLDEERRKLDDEQRAFHDYLRRLTEARDKEEFDRFMAERAAPKPASE